MLFVLHAFLGGLAGAQTSGDPKLEEIDKMLSREEAKAESKKEDTKKEPPSAMPSPGYLLQPGDKIRVKIYPEDEYLRGGEMEVSSEGNLTLPLIGKVHIAGRSVTHAERVIAQLLAADYLVDPEVVLEVLEYRKQNFVVLGQVKKPGTYQFPPGETELTLLQAISMAGGFSEIANTKKIKIIRKTDTQNEVLQANAEAIMGGKDTDPAIEPGDVINVSESLF